MLSVSAKEIKEACVEHTSSFLIPRTGSFFRHTPSWRRLTLLICSNLIIFFWRALGVQQDALEIRFHCRNARRLREKRFRFLLIKLNVKSPSFQA